MSTLAREAFASVSCSGAWVADIKRWKDTSDSSRRSVMVMMYPYPPEGTDNPFAKEETVSAKIPISAGVAKYLEDYPLSAFEAMIARAMELQVFHGWDTEAAVREAMKEVPA